MRQILTKEFGLVGIDPRKWSPSVDLTPDDSILVWEDEQGTGRYRVRFIPKQQNIAGKDHDMIVFHYWLNQRLRKEVMEKDPMKPALERVLTEAKDYIVLPHIYYQQEAGLDKVITWIDEERKGN